MIPSDVRQAIALGIHSWLEPFKKDRLLYALNQLPEDIKYIYDQQTNIGWDHFIRGRISISWGDYINKALANTNNSFNTELWGSKIVSINFKYILSLWDHRCKEEHGCNAHDIETKLKDKLINEIQHIQKNFKSNHYKDGCFIHRNIEELQEQDSGQLQSWLVGARILYKKFKNSIRRRVMFSNDEQCIQQLENDPG